jgi:hypothetical protein
MKPAEERRNIPEQERRTAAQIKGYLSALLDADGDPNAPQAGVAKPATPPGGRPLQPFSPAPAPTVAARGGFSSDAAPSWMGSQSHRQRRLERPPALTRIRRPLEV